ncbi:VanZ family protein [Halobaculum gomorrense]|uniref:VanZ like family protein n=1 Tax=Halobaculum gomorrense TaxID=43928 RepID=A0A1M5UYL8_9EURY|nr:VanZ family protein [Halobaculum gomorrense]SHH68095.1 VanZ like family protein [Halobaculum gomorrense]
MSWIPFPLLPRWLRYLGVVAVLGVIGYFSLLTAPPSAPSQTSFWDKRLHFAAYAGLALALAYATVRYRDRPAVRATAVVGGALGVGIGIELVQGTLPNRYFGWGDLLANTLGSVLVGIWFLIERRVRYVRIRMAPNTDFSK